MASSGATVPEVEVFPAFAISPVDAEQIARLSDYGPVRIRLASDAGWGDIRQSQNVVATVPGYDANAEPILIAAHIDSWGQGTGAVDDGFGIAVVITAAYNLLTLANKTRRGIRLVLFGAEEVTQPGGEQNFPGAVAFARRHRDEIKRIALAAESDWGGGIIKRLSLPVAPDSLVLEKVKTALLPYDVVVTAEQPLAAGPDISVLSKAGVPCFQLHQEASGLFDIHHNSNDTLAAVDADALQQNVAVWTALLKVLANEKSAF